MSRTRTRTSARFTMSVYFDGSAAGGLSAPGVTPDAYGGINERLDAADARLKKTNGKSALENGRRPCIVTWPKATTLSHHHDPHSGGWTYINGDLGRSHYPQHWAEGFLPLFPRSRMNAWMNNPDDDLLRFKITNQTQEQIEAFATVYIACLLSGWEYGFVPEARRPQDYRTILCNAGFPSFPTKTIRAMLGKAKSLNVRDLHDWNNSSNNNRLRMWQAAIPFLVIPQDPGEQLHSLLSPPKAPSPAPRW